MKILRFSALWCPSCLIMKSRWDKAMKGRPAILVDDFDFDADESAFHNHGIGTILPVLLLEKDGIEAERIIGEISVKELQKTLDRWLS